MGEVKYLHIDNGSKYGNQYVVRVQKYGKSFVVWKGTDYNFGTIVAKKVQELINVSFNEFIDWYDNDLEVWLKNVKQNKNEG